jgi:phosphate/sulfate permease
VRAVLLSLLLTAGIAQLIGAAFGWPVSELYIIVSIAVAGLGDKWLDVLESIKTRLQTMITTGGTKP